MASDLAFWEVVQTDGVIVREQDGNKYPSIDRSKLAKFRLVNSTGNVIFETWPPVGKTGHQLVYRRRTGMTQSSGGRKVIFVIGWLMDGPAFAININDGTFRVLETGFEFGDADLYPPEPMPGELWFDDGNKFQDNSKLKR